MRGFRAVGAAAIAVAAVTWLLLPGLKRSTGADGADAVRAWSSEARVRVEVLNGGGRAGAARAATTFLRDAGYDVVYFGNAASFDNDSTRVIDRVDRPGVASAVARSLGIDNVLSEPDPNLFVDVSVVLGADWEVEELVSATPPVTRGRRWWDPRAWIGR